MKRPAYMEHRKGEPWTYPQLRAVQEARATYLRTNGAEGESTAQIARRLGVSPRSIQTECARHGLTKPQRRRTLPAVEALLSDGCARTTVELAEAVGASVSGVRAALRELRQQGRVVKCGRVPRVDSVGRRQTGAPA